MEAELIKMLSTGSDGAILVLLYLTYKQSQIIAGMKSE
jgi:hypothetical protein